MIASLLVIVIGFITMSGGDTNSSEIFNPEQFNFRRLSLAPTIILAGYGLLFFAILKKPTATHDK